MNKKCCNVDMMNGYIGVVVSSHTDVGNVDSGIRLCNVCGKVELFDTETKYKPEHYDDI